jgi:hypothetical protein
VTHDQRDQVLRLQRCAMVAPWDRRFVRSLARSLALSRDGLGGALTPKQADMLDTLCHRYRRQLGALSPPTPPPSPEGSGSPSAC